MNELKKLPLAIEVSVLLKSARAASSTTEYTSTEALNGTRTYRQVVNLPMAPLSESSSSKGSSQSTGSSSSSSSSGSSTSGTSSASGSAFGDQ
jgi:hypothetical protein